MWIPNRSTEGIRGQVEIDMSVKKALSRVPVFKQGPLERIRTIGDPVLRQQTKRVDTFDSRLHKLAEVMLEVMRRDDGVGLAANQIGVVSRVMVWRDPDNEDETYVFVNPQIVERSEACCTTPEGCLSVPGVTMDVERFEEVVVEAQDLSGQHIRVTLRDLPARIAQHEIDHLDGVLIVDRTPPEERRRVMKELREQSLTIGT